MISGESVRSELRHIREAARLRRLIYEFRSRGLSIAWTVGFHTSPDARFAFGQGCQIQRGALIYMDRATLTLGDHVLVGEYCNIRPYESFVRIGSRVQLAQFVSLIATNHEVDDHGVPQRTRSDLREGRHGITIGDDCWIGVGATLLPGVVLGDRCVVGAGAVVSRGTYQDGSRLVGVPALTQ
jgi:acetyltransferase-like isoleucine patch superfamily enzyme